MTLPRTFRKLTFGARLRFLRERAGDGATVAARKLKMGRCHIYALEGDSSSNPTLKTMLAIVSVYDISLTELVEGLKP